MKGLILYFSGTGNTKYISNVIFNELKTNGNDVVIRSFENTSDIPNSYDFLVIGFPKFFEYTPIFLIDIIRKKIPSAIKKTQTILFCTESGPTKTSFYDVEQILNEKNHTVVTTKSFRMPNNYYLKSYYKPTSPLENIERINKSKIEAEDLVHQFLNKNYSIERVGRFKTGLFRNLAYKNNDKLGLFSQKFSVNSTCTSCKLCEANCPVKNITLVDGIPKFNKSCVLCLRCINTCPMNSILYDNKKLHQYKFPTEELVK